MKVTSPFLIRLHLDKTHQLLNGRSFQMLRMYFKALDVRDHDRMDDIAFLAFMRASTDLSTARIYSVFEMFDVDASGYLDFDEFYLLCCMLISIKNHEEKAFSSIHSRTCFELLDADGSGSITLQEFQRFGFMFNISQNASQKIFRHFDVDDSQELDYEEFRMFTLACLEMQQEMEQLQALQKNMSPLRKLSFQAQRWVKDRDLCQIQ
eukprot:jgi/Chlat1/6240/Chrsp44S05848